MKDTVFQLNKYSIQKYNVHQVLENLSFLFVYLQQILNAINKLEGKYQVDQDNLVEEDKVEEDKA